MLGIKIIKMFSLGIACESIEDLLQSLAYIVLCTSNPYNDFPMITRY